jgi:hypothetical protein
MKIKNFIIALVSIIALIILWLFLDERNKSKRKEEIIDRLTKENQSLKSSYLELLQNFLKAQGNTPPNVIEELKRLKNQIDHLETGVHIELDSVIKLVHEGQGTKAIRDLTKIVENKLKEKALNDESFKKTPMLNNLLEHAFHCKWISSRQYENACKLKDIRNKESHELAVVVDNLEIGMSIFTGIDIIYTINRQ